MSEASPRGTYLVISEALRRRIGQDKAADAVPSEAELMREHGVSRNAIQRARFVRPASPRICRTGAFRLLLQTA